MDLKQMGCVSKRTQMYQKSWNHLKIPDVRQVTCSKCHTEDLQTLHTTEQNLVAWDLCTLVHGCLQPFGAKHI
jgi:hypothetical protein